MKVKELMKKAYVIDKNISLSEAAKVMSSRNIGCLIFVVGKKPKGILTERDLLRNFNRNPKVTEVMSKSLVTIEPGANVQEALNLMNDKKIKRLPVVESGVLVGIITATDLLSSTDELEGDFFFE